MKRSVLSASAGPFLGRGISFAISGAASIALTRGLIEKAGPEGFALGSLIVSLTWTLPLLTDGSRSIIVNTVAGRVVEQGSREAAVVLRAARIQVVVAAAVLTLTGIAVAMFGLWNEGGNTAPGLLMLVAITGVALALMALSSPGSASLQARGYQTRLSLLPAVASVLALVLLYVIPWPDGSISAVGVTALAGAITASITAAASVRFLNLPFAQYSDLLRGEGARPQRGSGAHVFVPATVVTACWVFFTLSDRFLLAPHVSGAALAAFVVIQMTTSPFLTLASAASEGLWPYVIGHRRRGTLRARDIVIGLGLFAVMGLVLGALIAVLGPWVAQFVFGAPQQLGPEFVAIGVYVTVATCNLGAMAMLRNEPGFRYLAVVWSLALVLKLITGYLAAQAAGTMGLIVASTVVLAMLLCANVIRVIVTIGAQVPTEPDAQRNG